VSFKFRKALLEEIHGENLEIAKMKAVAIFSGLELIKK